MLVVLLLMVGTAFGASNHSLSARSKSKDPAKDYNKGNPVALSALDTSATQNTTAARKTSDSLPSGESVQNALFPQAAKNRSALVLDEVSSSTLSTAEAGDPSAAAARENSTDPILLKTFPYHFRNALRFRQLGENARALEELDKALQINPNHLECRLEMGDCLVALNRVSEALTQYQKAAEQHPVEASPWLRMGDVQLKSQTMDRLDKARAFFQKAMELEPNSRTILMKLASLEREAGNIPAAIQAFQNLLLQDEKNPEAHLNLGLLLQSTSPQDALEHLRRYLQLKGKNSDPQTRLLVEKFRKEIEQNKPAKTPKPQE
jgi:tetratricopeptide (TPR) repeat protein